MIEFDAVTKRYSAPGRSAPPALADVSLRVHKGEVVAVVGPNGAGKSTLLGLLLGFLHQNGGRVGVEGRAPRDWVRRNGASYLPERFSPAAEWRVDRMLLAFARLEGLAPGDAATRVSAVIRRFGLTQYATREIGTLSRGLLQRLGLAQTALADRRLVVFDEPTEGLDPHGRIVFRETVDALRRADCTVIIASHDLAELERVADRALLLDAGRLRETVSLHRAADLEAWILHLDQPFDAVQQFFPGATSLMARPDPARRGADAGTREAGVRFNVSAGGAREMTARLAALIAAGAVVHSVIPAGSSLEDRVRASLGDDTAEGSV